MKTLVNKLSVGVLGTLLLAACQKDDPKAMLTSDPSTVKIELSATQSTIVLDSAHASTTDAVTFSWNAANYGAHVSVNYTLWLDTTTGFTNPTKVSFGNAIDTTYTKQMLNDLALGMGLTIGKATTVHLKLQSDVIPSVIASAYSNSIAISINPYSELPAPKYAVPDSLYITGDATPGSWQAGGGSGVPWPSQKFTRIDYAHFGIILQLTGGKSYVFIPKNGDWSHKYNPSISGANPAGDSFAPDAGNNNMVGPANDGLYKIIVDFVKGTYTVTALSSNPIPANLYIIGDATDAGWDNSSDLDAHQHFKQISNGEFQLIANITAGLNPGNSNKPYSFLFLPVDNGDWSHKYGGATADSGTLLADGDVPGSNTPTPATSGSYLINVNFFSMQYTFTKQ